MKKILYLLILITTSVYAQLPPANFPDGVETKLIQLDTLTTAEKLALPQVKGTVVYDVTLNALQSFDGASWVSGSGGGGSQNLKQVTDLGATTDNSLTISSNTTPNLTVNNTGTFRAVTLYGENLVFNRDSYNLNIKTPTLLGNYDLQIPQLTANDTIALKSELSGLGLQNIIDDTTPQLGGNLDVNGNRINSNGTLDFYIDADNNGTDSRFRVFSNTGTNLFEIKEDGTLFAPSMSDAKIVTQGNSALITKGYADVNYMGGSNPDAVEFHANSQYKEKLFVGTQATYDSVFGVGIERPDGAITFITDLTQEATKYAEVIGDNSTTSFVLTHNLSASNVVVQVSEVATNKVVFADVFLTSANTVTVNFNTAPTTNEYKIIIIK